MSACFGRKLRAFKKTRVLCCAECTSRSNYPGPEVDHMPHGDIVGHTLPKSTLHTFCNSQSYSISMLMQVKRGRIRLSFWYQYYEGNFCQCELILANMSL